jgi:RimJ/RimL family protein N-acetyltransferase
MVSVYLETPRLTLRRMTEADTDAMVALDSDPEVMRHLTGGVPTPRADIENWVMPIILGHYATYAHYGVFAAIARESGEFLGWFHFRPPYEEGLPGIEIGYRLKQSAWGRGLATEGTRAIIQKAFEELGESRVIAKTLKANTASQRVMEKAGMRFVREFIETRIDPPQPAVWYALDRADYRPD